MISWSDIEAECTEFRQGLVSVYRKYEGMDTDERTAQDHVVKVTARSFARHMGIAESTFGEWVRKSEGAAASRSERAGSWTDREKKAAAEATAKAEAAAQKRLDAALAAQAKATAQKEREANLKHQQELEAERKRVAKEEAAKNVVKLQDVEAKLRAEIKAELPTPEVLAEMAKRALTSSDPDIVSRMAEAYGKHRVEQDARNQQDARARQAASRARQAEQDANNAARRASQEYEDSALKLFLDAYAVLVDTNHLLSRKPITFSNVVASGLTAGEVEDRVEEAIEFIKRVEASVLDATMENVQSS